MSELDRRTVLRGAGAVGVAVAVVPVLAACGSGSEGSAGSGGDSGAATSVTVATASVPVGGGAIQDKVVVTQPVEGDFKAFSAICPHQGCSVDAVKDDVISCPCHGSKFSALDGAKISGPATTGLSAMVATVSGANVVVT